MAQGIELPVSLQIANLKDIAQQLKVFSGKNILEGSLGGKKVEAELNNVLKVLGQLEVRAKNTFKSSGDFNGFDKDINKVELGLEHVQNIISNLSFKDLKIPSDAADQINDLNARIKELNNGFLTFKASQKEKLLANNDFTAGLSTTFGKNASTILAKNYDEMYKAIHEGMERVNLELIAQKAKFEQNSQIVTQNTSGRANFTAWGALDFISKAFESLPKDKSKYSEQQKMLAQYMNIDEEKQQFTNFKGGASHGANAFFNELASRFELSESQLQDIKNRVTEKAKKLKISISEEIRRIATNKEEGASIFGENNISYEEMFASRNSYATQVKNRDSAQGILNDIQAKYDAGSRSLEIFRENQRSVAEQQQALEQALEAPTSALERLQEQVRQATLASPELGAAYGQAAAEIQKLQNAVDEGRTKLQNLDTAVSKLSGVSSFINRYIGVTAIVTKVVRAIRSAFNNIKELDKSITNIAVVTNMSQADLWGKIGEYTQMAQQYGVATKEVYTVSQLFYQQGLQTNQVMSLTTETLKMAKIAGMGYEDAANAMTVAIRAFKIEMTNAQSVTDTYSALAAKFAVSSSEIANAMEKTASSAANVGMSLQSTSAFISVMTQTTRESAQNIGSALKSIISRYGEMKASPSSMLNIEGEDVAFNKVDTALKSIGISIKDASGQFRDFDDVIMELAEKWDSLDNNTQRYVATVMAGNRQQSRFIALVSNYDELKRAMSTANEAENASIVQVAKTMDSLETKAQQLQNAFSQIYLDLHIEDGLKDLYTGLTNILKTIGNLGVKNGALPTLMNIIGFGTGAKSLVNLAKDRLNEVTTRVNVETGESEAHVRNLRALAEQPINTRWNVDTSQFDTALARAGMINQPADLSSQQNGNQNPALNTTQVDRHYRSKVRQNNIGPKKQSSLQKTNSDVTAARTVLAVSAIARIAGTAIAAYGASQQDKSTDKVERSKIITGFGNGLSMAGTFAQIGLMTGSLQAALVAGIIGLLVGGLGAVLDGLTVSIKEKLAMQQEELEEAQNESMKKQAKVTSLKSSIENIETLRKSMYNSVDDMKAYKDAMNTLAEEYPSLISAYDEAGNAIIDITSAEATLASIRSEGAKAAEEAAIKQVQVYETQSEAIQSALTAIDTIVKQTAVAENPGNTLTFSQENGLPLIVSSTFENEQYTYDYQSAISELGDSLKIDYHTYEGFQDIINKLINTPELVTAWKQNKETYEWETITREDWKEYQNSIKDTSSYFDKTTFSLKDLDTIITDFPSLFNNAKDALSFAGFDSDTEVTDEILQSIYDQIMGVLNRNKIGLENVRKIAEFSTIQSDLFNLSNNLISNPKEVNRFQSNNIYSRLFSHILTGELDTEKYSNLYEWQNDKEGNYAEISSQLSNDFIQNWYNSLTNTQKDILESIDFTEYTNVNSIMDKIGLRDNQKNSAIIQVFAQQFKDSTQANRDRILKTVYAVDENSKIDKTQLNKDFENLDKLFLENKNGGILRGGSIAMQIAEFFDSENPIISKYADYFTDQLVSINKLADQGYTALAGGRLNSLYNLADTIVSIEGTGEKSASQIQQDLFGVITSIDFSSYSDIIKAQKSIQEYGTKNGIDVSDIANTLSEAANNLIFNVTTLAQEITDQITSVTKGINETLSTNKSGLSFDKAIEEFNKLDSAFEEIENFQQVFSYDAVLGKYVYTQEGLQRAIQNQEQQLFDEAEQFDKVQKIYTEQINNQIHNVTGFTKQAIDISKKRWNEETVAYTAKDVMTVIQKDLKITDSVLLQYYESLAQTFESQGGGSWEDFISFVEDQIDFSKEQAENAEVLLSEHRKNKKNQYYQAIDWSKLALGTDLTQTNYNMLESLAAEFDTWGENITENDKVIGRKLQEGIGKLDWNEVLDEYLSKTYSDENMRAAAKAAIKGQIASSQSQQISTAISELLEGTGKVLSDTTIALIQQQGILDSSKYEDGVLQAGANYTQSAITLYDNLKDGLLTVAEKNNTYASIISKNFEQGSQIITTLTSGAGLDINQIKDTFTTLDIELSTYFNGQDWINGAENFLETNAFGKTKIKNWDGLIAVLKAQRKLTDEMINSPEFASAYSSYVDGMITLDTQMIDLIKKSYDNAFSSITEWKPMNVSKLSANESFQNLLKENGAASIENGILVVQDAVQYAQNASKLFIALTALDSKALYDQTGWTSADLAKNWKNAQTVITAVKDSWTGIAENISSLSADNISTLIEKGGLQFNEENRQAFVKIGDNYVLSLNKYEEFLEDAVAPDTEIITPAQRKQVEDAYLKAQQTIINKITGLDWTKILDGSATEFESTEFINNLQLSLSSLGIAIGDLYFDGSLNITALKNKLKGVNNEVASQIIKSLDTTIASVRDSIFEELGTSANLLIEGTTSQAEITKFVQNYNKLIGGNATVDNLFKYDDLTQTFTLIASALRTYQNAQKQQLIQLGINSEYIDKYLENQAQQLIGLEMDISGFVSETDISNDGKATQTLMSQIRNWYAISGTILDTSISQIMQSITAGGEEAVKYLKQFKGEQNVTSDEIQAVYRAQFNRLSDAAEQLTEVVVNSIVTGNLATLLDGNFGFKVTQLGDGTAVVNAVGDMVAVYNQIYQQMKTAAGATTKDLNSTFAKMLTAKDQGNIDAIEALNNAMGMSYEALGDILAQYGKGVWSNLETVMKYGQSGLGIESLGNGQIRINDFTKFASRMNWEVGGEAYTEALNAYNDSLIQLDRKVGKQIAAEIKAVSEAKTGDRINLTYLSEALGITDKKINKILENTGATISKGILTISDGAKIPEIINTLASLAQSNSQLIASELAELADAVSDFIDNLINLITSGIGGTLKNTEAQSLQEWATSQGLGQLDFIQTAEGLKLSQTSAIGLYNALKNVDTIKAKLVFDELNDSLKESNEHYESISSIQARILELESIAPNARSKEYQQELDLAKQILAVRSTTDDDSFNFMSNKIPAAQNNPLNYFSNWQTGWQALQEGIKSGYMDYTQFYNLFTEMGNLAEKSGAIKIGADRVLANSSDAAKLIEEAAHTLTVDASTGQLKINLGQLADLGVDFSAAGADMEAGVTKGIQDFAKSQVEMLDGMIQVLETIVAMDKLGDVAGEDQKIELGEIFITDKNGNIIITPDGRAAYTQKYQDTAKAILDIAVGNKELAASLEKIQISGYSLKSILSDVENGFKDINIDPQVLTNVMNSLYQAAISGNYDLDNIYESIVSVLGESGLGGTIAIDVGDTTVLITGKAITTIDWSNTDTQEIVKQFAEKIGKDEKTAQAQLRQELESYENGTIPTDIIYVLAIKHNLKIENGRIVSVDINGTTYEDVTPGSQAFGMLLAEDLGFDLNGKEIEYDEEGKFISFTTKVGVKDIKTEVDATTGEAKYYGLSGKSYADVDSLLEGEMQIWNETHGPNEQYTSQKEFNWGVFRIPTQITPQFTVTTTGEKVDPTNDPTLRGELEKLASGGKTGIEEVLAKKIDNGDGTYTVNIGDYSFTFTGGEDPATALQTAINEWLGIDTTLSSTISTAISNAFSDETVQKAISTAISQGFKEALTGANGEIEIPTITLKPEQINLDITGASIATGENNDNSNGFTIKGITAEVSSYSENPKADKTALAQNIAALITSYSENPEGVDTGALAQDIAGLITSYTESPKIDKTKLAQDIAALITSYTDEGVTTDNLLVKALTAIITTYDDQDADPNTLVEALTAYIKEYKDKPGVEKPTLEDLIQFIKDINTLGADAALEKWRAKQEGNAIKIPVETTPPPPTGKEGLESTKAEYYNVGNGTLTAIVQESIDVGDTNQLWQILNDFEEALTNKDYIPSDDDLSALKLIYDSFINETLGKTAEEIYKKATTVEKEIELDNDIYSDKSIKVPTELELSQMEPSEILAYLKNLSQEIENGKTQLTDADKVYVDFGLQMENDAIKNTAEEISDQLEAVATISGDNEEAQEKIEETEQGLAEIDNMNANPTIGINDQTNNSLNNIKSRLSRLAATKINLGINTGIKEADTKAKGNVALAAGTLMGELGPELYVQGGRYFIAGQNGAEFVNLASDAIVFNHQQTASLLKNGKASRGKPVTNESNAISYAKGNIHGGPAMASASAALAALKQLKAQWEAIAGLSAKDLAGAGGGGGGGGGDKAFIKELEKWYNWLQEIATLEKRINQYEAERNTIQSSWVKNGYKYFESQKESLAALREQVKVQADLTKSQMQYFNTRRAELNSNKNPFRSLYSFDENGQIKYENGKLEEFTKMIGTNEYDKPNMTPEEQYKYITKTLGIDAKYLQYDTQGNKIDDKDYAGMVQAFWDKIDADKQEMQSLYDSITEGQKTLEELQQKQNEILQEMRDNQMDLEQKVYDAMVDSRERMIEEMEDTKDAIEDANQKLIDGLNEALDKERTLHENSKSQKDLDKLIRQRDILMRSGGSAAEIASLNEEIEEKQFDAYLTKQQEQIDAIQEASDKQIEKLDAQIELENELLDYQKKYGLLWAEVTQIMNKSPEEIAKYISENDQEYWNKSPIAHEQDLNNLLFSSEQWAAFRDSDNIKLTEIQAIRDALVKEKEKGEKDSKNGKKDNNGGKNDGKNDGDKKGQNEDKDEDKNKKNQKHWGYTIFSDDSLGNEKISDRKMGFDSYAAAQYAANTALNSGNYIKGRAQIWSYDKGGIVPKTGMALVHAKEGVLTKEQTSILRNDILGNKPDSLLSIFQTLQDAYSNAGSTVYNSSNDSRTIQIDKMELNLNVDKLANDYDSRQAARTVMDEIVRIASKTSANNSVRR